MGSFPLPDHLVRAQQEWHATYRALAVPRPRGATELRCLLHLSARSGGIRSGRPRMAGALRPGWSCGGWPAGTGGRTRREPTDGKGLIGMGDLPPDLDRLRSLGTWLSIFLKRVREEIAPAERPVQPRAHRGLRPPRGPLCRCAAP
ncbi:hypothetical protein [Streptomyces griseus]|uniref:hypothetical protein n=1 Tax=Streptomyces griseus TaxID=1911 RepID=UPI0036A42FCD